MKEDVDNEEVLGDFIGFLKINKLKMGFHPELDAFDSDELKASELYIPKDYMDSFFRFYYKYGHKPPVKKYKDINGNKKVALRIDFKKVVKYEFLNSDLTPEIIGILDKSKKGFNVYKVLRT